MSTNEGKARLTRVASAAAVLWTTAATLHCGSAPSVEDADAGSVNGSTPDGGDTSPTGAPDAATDRSAAVERDSALAADAGSPPDSSVHSDARFAADAGSPDSSVHTDAGVAADAGNPADSGSRGDASGGGDAARPADRGADAPSGDASVAGPPDILAMGSGQVEVFVNGVSLGKSSAPRALLSAAATIRGAENEIVVRASGGGAANPFVLTQASGVFGKAGTSNRWKAKAAVGTETTDPTGPWATLAFDDSAWATATDVNVAPAAPFLLDGPARGIWTSAATDATVLLRLKLYVPAGLDAATPTGFAAGVTGGQGGPVVTVTTIAQFVQAVADNSARVVEFSGLLDFSGTEGPVTASSCFQSQCADGTFEYITNDLGACTSAGKPTFNVTFDQAGKTAVTVGSNKTILGIGPNATLKGKGLRMINGVSNVVVRNVTITDINPQIVWGGDAILIDNASRIWIDHVRVSLVGRQFFVTGFGPASNVTLSWNEFDGRTQWSATCNGAHYWAMLIAGSNDTITVADNWIHHTSGRGPHAGGLATTFDWMQFANDLYETVPGHAADPSEGSTLLYEGTVFNQVTTPVVVEATMAGAVYAPLASTAASTNAACQASLGRVCVANVATPQNGTFPLDQAALTGFSTRRTGLVVPYPASEVVNAVPHLAGPGHI